MLGLRNNLRRIESLEKTRDTLLPKLLSGEVGCIKNKHRSKGDKLCQHRVLIDDFYKTIQWKCISALFTLGREMLDESIRFV